MVPSTQGGGKRVFAEGRSEWGASLITMNGLAGEKDVEKIPGEKKLENGAPQHAKLKTALTILNRRRTILTSLLLGPGGARTSKTETNHEERKTIPRNTGLEARGGRVWSWKDACKRPSLSSV